MAFESVAGFPISCDRQSGVCRGTNQTQINTFAALQRAANAAQVKVKQEAANVDASLKTKVAALLKLAPLGIDGIIGSKTVTLVNALYGLDGVPPRTTEEVATQAMGLAPQLAIAAGVEIDFSPPQLPGATSAVTLPEPLAPPSPPEGKRRWPLIVGGLVLVGIASFFGYRVLIRPARSLSGGDEFDPDEYDYEDAVGDFIDV